MSQKRVQLRGVYIPLFIGLVSGAASVIFASIALPSPALRDRVIAAGIGFFCAFSLTFFEMGIGLGPLKRLALPVTALIRIVSYSIVLFTANFFGIAIKYTGTAVEVVNAVLNDTAFINAIPFSIALSVVFNFIMLLINLIGGNTMLKLLLGQYHHPREESRIFMFLDIRSSTSIAEKIGHLRFLNLLNDFFFDISRHIMSTKGEIYKYVGDEVIITWTMAQGLRDANCIRLYFLQERTIQARREYYMKQYGVVPNFKAGIHCGKVIAGELGALRIEIGYLGDVLNTTARIESLCNEKKEALLVSGSLFEQLTLPDGLKAVRHGEMKLRGKEIPVSVIGIQQEES